ncbi:MAG: hypothetical protein AAFU34_15590 [Pseudomonadota bacterium]
MCKPEVKIKGGGAEAAKQPALTRFAGTQANAGAQESHAQRSLRAARVGLSGDILTRPLGIYGDGSTPYMGV